MNAYAELIEIDEIQRNILVYDARGDLLGDFDIYADSVADAFLFLWEQTIAQHTLLHTLHADALDAGIVPAYILRRISECEDTLHAIKHLALAHSVRLGDSRVMLNN